MITKTNNRTRLSVAGLTYDFDFRIDAITDLEVYGITAAEVSTLLTTGFTITFDADAEEGTVTFVAEPSTYAEILMLRAKPYEQNVAIPIRGGFDESVIEKQGLDNLAMQIQQIKEITDYCVKQDVTQVLTPIDLVELAEDIAIAEAAATAAVAAQVAAEAAAAAAASASLTMAQIMEATNPIGTVRTFGVSTNPEILLGFTSTWTAIAGKVIVGIDGTQVEFDTLNETGGEKTHTLTVDELAPHTHSTNIGGISGSGSAFDGTGQVGTQPSGSAGGGQAHNNLQPYIVKYCWERTA